MSSRSPAAQYTIGMSVWMVLYMAAIIFNGIFFRRYTAEGPLLYALAVMPALPIGGTILTMLRYIEKSDEFIRAQITRRFILATGITLFICTAYGFLENYAGLQHFDLYYVYVLFWAAFGIISLILRGR
ncbi:hypothetical protein [Asticcacaulis sp. AC466]|uniref:hypothetical protein n=1 Tax=Asticcacaulis sp. AC466 TaxID=1282362 RepID=UPI0004CE17D9|nr:hypothetical protein [Asticcacaulis sp. AC466]